MNVKFIQIAGENFKAWTNSYVGRFVHLTSAATVDTTVYKAGLYFGGTAGWEYLTNDTNVAEIESKINTAIEGLDEGTISSVTKSDDGLTLTFKGVKEANGIIAQGEGDETLELKNVALTGKAKDVKLGAITSGTETVITDGTNLQDAMNSTIERINALRGDSALVLKKDGDVADTVSADGSTYVLYQGTKEVAKFNIAKDTFVKDGRIVTEGDKTYVVLDIKESGADGNTKSTVKVDVSSLIEYSTAGDGLKDVDGHKIALSDDTNTTLAKVDTGDKNVSTYVADAIENINVGAVSGEFGGVKVSVSQSKGKINQPVVEVTGATVEKNETTGALSVKEGDGTKVLTGASIATIQQSIASQVENSSTATAANLKTDGTLEGTSAGVKVGISEANGIISAPTVEVTAATTDDTLTTPTTPTSVLDGSAIAHIKKYVDDQDSATKAAIQGTGGEALTLAGLNTKLGELNTSAYQGVENADADQLVTVSAKADNKQTLSVKEGVFTGQTGATDGLATVAKTEAYVATKVADATKAITDLDNTGANATGTNSGVSVTVEQVDGAVQTPVVAVADNAVTVSTTSNTMTVASADNVLKGSAVNAIKTYVDDAVADAKGALVADLKTSGTLEGTSAGVKVGISEAGGVISAPSVSVTAATATSGGDAGARTLTTSNTDNVLTGAAVGEIKKYVDNVVSDVDTSVTTIETNDTAYSDTGVNVVTKVTETATGDGKGVDYSYAISSTAELVWMNSLD